MMWIETKVSNWHCDHRIFFKHELCGKMVYIRTAKIRDLWLTNVWFNWLHPSYWRLFTMSIQPPLIISQRFFYLSNLLSMPINWLNLSKLIHFSVYVYIFPNPGDLNASLGSHLSSSEYCDKWLYNFWQKWSYISKKNGKVA